MARTSIIMDSNTREELRLLGVKGDTYEDIILKLIEHWKKTKK